MTLERGVRGAIDVGRARIGVAVSDADGLLATPLETIARDHDGTAHFDRLVALGSDLGIVTWYVGLPLSLSGSRTASTDDAIEFARIIEQSVDVPVLLVDERMTTVTASAQLHASGKRTREQRSVIDQVAAVILLQHALDAERQGNQVGRPVSDA